MGIETISNGTTIIINEQTSNDWIGIVIASVVAIITLIGIVWSNLQTRKSNELLKKDIETKIRPWIVPLKFKPTYAYLDNTGLDFETWALNREKYPQDPKTVKIGIQLKNTGILPAKNFQFKSQLKTNQEYTRDELEKMEYHSNTRTIFPNEEFDVDVTIPYETFKIVESGKLWLGFMAKYDINERKQEVIGLIGYLEFGSARRRLTWSDEIPKSD